MRTFRIATSVSSKQTTKIEYPVISICILNADTATFAILAPPEDILAVPERFNVSDLANFMGWTKKSNLTLLKNTIGHRMLSSLNFPSGNPYASKCLTFDSAHKFTAGYDGAVTLAGN